MVIEVLSDYLAEEYGFHNEQVCFPSGFDEAPQSIRYLVDEDETWKHMSKRLPLPKASPQPRN